MSEPLSWSSEELKHMVDRPRFGLEEPAYREYIARHVLGLTHGMRVADVGCGSAASSLTLAPYLLPDGALVGYDQDAAGLENARKNAQALKLTGFASFIQASATSLPANTGAYDVTLCQTVLMHVPDPDAVLAEMVRVTTPGGLVAATEPDFSTSTVTHLNGASRAPEDAGLWAQAMARVHAGGCARRMGDWTIGAHLTPLFRRLGLRMVRTRPVPASWMVFPGADGRATAALLWALDLFYPPEDSSLFAMQRENHASAGGLDDEWRRFADLRRRERTGILGTDGGASAVLHVHTSAYITVGRVPEDPGHA